MPWSPSLSRRHRGGLSVVVSDTFNRGNGAIGTADSGQSWSVLAGTWVVNTNQAQNSVADAGNQGAAVVDAAVSNCTVQCTFPVALNETRVVFRMSDLSNGYVFQSSAANTTLDIYKQVATVYSNIATTPGSVANGDVIQVVLSGPSIIVKKNGTQILSASDSFNQTATKHGIGAGTASTAARFDDFRVTVP